MLNAGSNPAAADQQKLSEELKMEIAIKIAVSDEDNLVCGNWCPFLEDDTCLLFSKVRGFIMTGKENPFLPGPCRTAPV